MLISTQRREDAKRFKLRTQGTWRNTNFHAEGAGGAERNIAFFLHAFVATFISAVLVRTGLFIDYYQSYSKVHGSTLQLQKTNVICD
jgi:hypothetical protein